MAHSPDHKIKRIRALARGLDVLRTLQATGGQSLHDLHLATRLPKATLTRIVATLKDSGLVWRRIADGAYLPSHALRERARHLDDETRLVEVASPVLDALCRDVNWPSILAVPRLEYMEVIETNSPRAYLHHIPLGPVGFRVNMLRSATGRAYLAFCSPAERDAVLARLRASSNPLDAVARDRRWVNRVLDEVRALTFAVRNPDLQGRHDRRRAFLDDGRNSIAVPVTVEERVVGCINLTWTAKVTTAAEVAGRHLAALKAAASEIAGELARPSEE
jgi:IclR family mhp operon transcriptional activator